MTFLLQIQLNIYRILCCCIILELHSYIVILRSSLQFCPQLIVWLGEPFFQRSKFGSRLPTLSTIKFYREHTGFQK